MERDALTPEPKGYSFI